MGKWTWRSEWQIRRMRKLEMKMTKKIAVNCRLITVREPFVFGLLERYPVYNNGGKKGESFSSAKLGNVNLMFAFGLQPEGHVVPHAKMGSWSGVLLRGTIKDSGILCFCSLCGGRRVVSPSVFEIHACKAYKRASQYICLENGTSLLDAVKACEKSSLKSLEQTIQGVIGPSPVQDSIICQNCNGSMKSQASSTNATGLKARSSAGKTLFSADLGMSLL
ncbi:hypothetical protein RJ639_044682 [Escallonia herrerae]|uniref:Tify domain-containing protein n=1 Tax=Escallonia herrerae TaxID=1293975 RepID=A0AA88WFT7_9ASTE|nr:hypothetical protein RJ639_044682 [Escallonia herrerae]